MNIVKEKIKLYASYPNWKLDLNKIRNYRKQKVFLIGTPVHGNLGDHAIAMQALYFLNDYFPEYECFEVLMPMYNTQKKVLRSIVNDNDLIVISGGGWMGNLWLHNEIVIREIIADYRNNRVVILPQTAYYTNDESGLQEYKKTANIIKQHNRLKMFVRERNTLNLFNDLALTGASKITLAPDMVLYGKNMCIKSVKSDKQAVISICIRNDCEALQNSYKSFDTRIESRYKIRKISTVSRNPIMIKDREKKLYQVWRQFRRSEITITDRLHAMLFSIMNGTPCIALDNKTGKVFGVAEWLNNTNMIIRASSIEKALIKIPTVLHSPHKLFDVSSLRPYFDTMARIMREE